MKIWGRRRRRKNEDLKKLLNSRSPPKAHLFLSSSLRLRFHSGTLSLYIYIYTWGFHWTSLWMILIFFFVFFWPGLGFWRREGTCNRSKRRKGEEEREMEREPLGIFFTIFIFLKKASGNFFKKKFSFFFNKFLNFIYLARQEMLMCQTVTSIKKFSWDPLFLTLHTCQEDHVSKV